MNVLLNSRGWFQLVRDFALSPVVQALFKVAFAVGNVQHGLTGLSLFGAEDCGGTLDRPERRTRSSLEIHATEVRTPPGLQSSRAELYTFVGSSGGQRV